MKSRNNNKSTIKLLGILLITSILLSCKKQDDFLNAKPQQSLATITSLSDVKKLLNNQGVFNEYATPGWAELNTDDFFLSSDSWLSNLAPYEQNASIFAKQIFSINDADNGWNYGYNQIYYANTILDALPKIVATSSELNEVKGSALFLRAFCFYELVQTYAMPFDSLQAKNQPGIPLRLTSNLNVKSIRASEEECYEQIISDLNLATTLLPNSSSLVTLPNKAASEGLLARVYLALGNYQKALQYSNALLSINNTLFDFNKIIANDYFLTDPSQFPLSEDIFHRTMQLIYPFINSRAIVDSTLYSLYEDNDLRKTNYFTNSNGDIVFKGSYELLEYGEQFSGIATDEMYLIRAESAARLGDVNKAINDLNSLLIKRYKAGTFVPRSAPSAADALRQILIERRKELCFRGSRWEDMRRLGNDPKYAITIKRIINGTTYILPPNDPRYAMEIPPIEIKLSGIQQNPR